MKIVSINQPAYLPWLGHLHRIAASDCHIVLDHVQFEKNSFVNRNKVRTGNGSCWLTVPVKTKGKFGELPIRALEINNEVPWREKHWKTMAQSYGKAPFWQDHRPFFEEVYKQEWRLLADLCRTVTSYLLKAFCIATPLLSSSDMEPHGRKDELVLDLCLKAGAEMYLSGPLGRNYLREEIFAGRGIEVRYQDYIHPEYAQAFKGFEPFMAGIDLLFNHGPESHRILLSGNGIGCCAKENS
ncbi:MAG: WbqC family protein [Desulfobacteraceae bacterium]|nr:WbqC family protein [Desulfobacteraceae bacterium]